MAEIVLLILFVIFVLTVSFILIGHTYGAGLEDGRKASAEPCLWTNDPIDGGWDAACGDKWELGTGTPVENNMHYCPFCGRKLEVKETTAHE